MKRAVKATTRWQDRTAAEFMKAPVVTLDEGVALREAAQALSDAHIGGAPVVSGRGEPLGVVSLFDIAAHLAGLERAPGEVGGFYRQGRVAFGSGGGEEPALGPEEGAPEDATVAEVMAPGLIGVRPETTLGEAARLLVEKQIHRVFVLDAKGRLQGVLSTMDLLRAAAEGR